MIIELKNLKVSRHLSEETEAFTATIYIDGKPAFHASNEGHGGCDRHHPIAPFTYEDLKRVNAWLKAHVPPMVSDICPDGLEMDLDLYTGQLMEEIERRRRLDRILKTKLAVIDNGPDGQPALFTYPAKHKPTPENIASLAAAIAEGKAKGRLVNGNPALETIALTLV